MKKDPEHRYQSSPELKDDTDSALAELGGYTPTSSVSERPEVKEPLLRLDSDLDIEHTE
jgi:hypothetical protein